MSFRLLPFLTLALALPAAAQQPGPAWLRTRTLANALNPNVSAILDFTATAAHTRQESGMRLREVELAFQGDVDPYARYDLYINKHHGEAVDVEEGYATLTSLPGRVSLRGGRFRANFGRLNMVHQHERPQIDSPLVLDSFLGHEGLRETGAEASRVFAPFGLFTELSYAFMNGLGEVKGGHDHGEGPLTTVVNNANGDPVRVRVERAEPGAPRRMRDYAHVARARAFHDLTDAANLELGVSGAIHQPREQLHRKLLGTDLTFRWRPPQQGVYRSLIWRSEVLWSRRHTPAEFDPIDGDFEEDPRRVDRRGAYSYLEIQPARRWSAGLRGDYAEDPASHASRGVRRALTPYVTFTLSEFNRFRAQVQRQWRAGRHAESLAQFQWVVVLGPHGAHPF